MRNDQRRVSHVGVFVTKQLNIAIAVLGLLLTVGSAGADEVSDGTAAYLRGDYAEALKLLRPTAEQGDAGAQYNLGQMYRNGEGVIQNNVIAHMLFNLAGAQGQEIGSKARDIVAERMTPSDISKAQEMARVCLEKNYKG